MNTVGAAFIALLFGASVWVMTVDLVRAVRSGSAVFRIGKWSGPWENPISRLTSPFAFWSAVIWTALWVIPLSVCFAIAAANMYQRL